MPAFEWVHVQLHQQKGMISLSPPTICNSAITSDIELSGAGCTTAITPNQLVQSSSENDNPVRV
ncbi:hypothetical protein CPH98_28590 [Klebsiella pneumoniae subsp. pneumoniae]|nr:hypothetical protein [Klebsiella pneumoniae subsp. pneumoniae]